MGKGGKSNEVEENMAAWLLGVNTLKIQPFNLPPLGTMFSSALSQNLLVSIITKRSLGVTGTVATM